jgi:hypothetical protein
VFVRVFPERIKKEEKAGTIPYVEDPEGIKG